MNAFSCMMRAGVNALQVPEDYPAQVACASSLYDDSHLHLDTNDYGGTFEDEAPDP